MKKKLNLKELQVKSFVTTIEAGADVRGGAIQTLPLNVCISRQAYSACQTCGIICQE